MARFLRSTATWKLSPPAVTGASTQFRPVKVTLAVRPEQAIFAHSRLRPPAAVSAAITYRPVDLTLVKAPQQPFAPHSKLRPPAAVAASLVFPPTKMTLAAVRSAPDQIRREPKSRLFPPTTVAASIVFAPVRRYLAWQFPRPATRSHWKLSPPAVTGAVVVAFIAAPVKVALAAIERLSERPATKSVLRTPAVVASSIVFAPVRRYLAWTFPRPATKTHSRLQPPTVTGAVVIVALAAPIRLSLAAVKTAADLIRRQPKSKLKPPAAVSAAIVFPPVESRLAPSGRQARATHAQLRPPAAVSASITFRPIQRTLAWQTPTPARVTRSKLRPPTVVSPFFAAPIRVSMIAARDAANFIRRKIRAPLVKIGIVSPFVPPTGSSFGLVFLSDAPGYDLDLATAVLYETAVAEDLTYTVAVQDEIGYGILGSGQTVYTAHLDDYPAS